MSCARSDQEQQPAPTSDAPVPQQEPVRPVEKTPARWYQGGTLHSATGANWREATPENKLATCADFIAKLRESGRLTDALAAKLDSVDALKAPAAELVVGLDKAFARDPDPKKDGVMAGRQVSEAATMLMVMMGWTR